MSDIDGVWETVTDTPMGQQKGTVTLQAEGGKLTGTMAGPQGSIDIHDGTVDGNQATWKANITNPMPMTLEFTATVAGDEISGSVKLGAFGDASFKGTRAS